MEPLTWTIPARSVPADGSRQSRKADDAERERVAKALDVLQCERLEFHYALTHLDHHRLRLEGRIEADFVQACVVTLEPLHRRYELDLALELWPADTIGTLSLEIESLDEDPEPIVAGVVDIGRLVMEELASGIDPYPRKDGASLDWQDPAEGQTRAFGDLDRLLRKER